MARLKHAKFINDVAVRRLIASPAHTCAHSVNKPCISNRALCYPARHTTIVVGSRAEIYLPTFVRPCSSLLATT